MKSTQLIVGIMYRFFQVLLVVAPVLSIAFWWLGSESTIASGIVDRESIQFIVINNTSRLWASVANLLPLSVIMYALVLLIRLFRNYKAKNIFTAENIYIYRKLSYLLLASVFIGYIYSALLSYIFTFQSSMTYINFVIKSSDTKTLIAAGICIVIANVMQEGRRISEEQEFTV